MPGAFDELHDPDTPAAPEHAQRQTERGGRFSLARAGMDNEQTFLDIFLSDFGVLHGFAFGHLGAMAFLRLIERSCHCDPFTTSGSPATRRTTRPARAATRALSRPWRS